ncbi:hypothetical protein K7G98_33280, partial [Saccharothrix sp. MB29]|nr:hypothetical protein [Saccharothrix sp. MB29]
MREPPGQDKLGSAHVGWALRRLVFVRSRWFRCLEAKLATTIPAREELVRKASDSVPLLQKHAAWAEEN